MKLNLGCGTKYKEGWVNVDIGNKDIYGNKIKVDIVHNLNDFPYPIKDNSVSEINAIAVIEHLESRTNLWNELRRICKKGCKIHIETPHYSGYSTYDDPTHYHRYSQFTAGMICEMWNFKLLKSYIVFSKNRFLSWINYLVNLYPRFYERFLANIIPSQEMYWEFEVN